MKKSFPFIHPFPPGFPRNAPGRYPVVSTRKDPKDSPAGPSTTHPPPDCTMGSTAGFTAGFPPESSPAPRKDTYRKMALGHRLADPAGETVGVLY